MNERIYLSPPHMGGDELKFVQEAFQSNWISPAGPHLDLFEKELADYNNTPHCAALSSGTAAIHLALIMLGVKQHDEVICSSFTFAGSCNPIVYQGATPVYVDSEDSTWNMDPQALRSAIEDRIRKGKKPKAIIVVHLYGMPAQMEEIVAIARHYDIKIIEDAAEGLGSLYKGKKLGSFGDIGIYSFNGNKIITTSGGGALVSENAEWVKQAKFLSTQARDQAPHYQHSQIGYNYRLSNISAGIGRGQLKVLDQRVARRRAIYDYYKKILGGLPGVSFQPELPGSVSNRWLTCMLLPATSKLTPETVRLALEKENIESRPLWKPMHLQPVFNGTPYYGSKASEDLFARGLCLPSGSSLTDAQLEKITTLVGKML
ncbi:aminotransferase class I/II-fold pyridoxal phosphate-dependent enzyme [Fulvivirgaceae bacterium PWU4]|uniref:GDP-perosamine synthase n=1 Tax=Chryseosolibacter histidini TaxID=2782349 RepID=A0AAP2GSB2_9BACT|nr:aminotransferase class I/II-fold pyridoxal phosphate-dependent enzyme [Chryseosolibacter histidini]MBT1700507.1 aminotransferase class I/II-fold pyridoxal phosphate-dependent enzyme [Chryseosolibacter histidini]